MPCQKHIIFYADCRCRHVYSSRDHNLQTCNKLLNKTVEYIPSKCKCCKACPTVPRLCPQVSCIPSRPKLAKDIIKQGMKWNTKAKQSKRTEKKLMELKHSMCPFWCYLAELHDANSGWSSGEDDEDEDENENLDLEVKISESKSSPDPEETGSEWVIV